MTNDVESGEGQGPDDAGREQDVDKAHEMATQMDPAASLAANMRAQAKELAGGEDPEKSANPLVEEFLRQARDFDTQSESAGEKAAMDHDRRMAVLLGASRELLGNVIASAQKAARGELRSEDLVRASERFSIQVPADRIEGLGVNPEEAKTEYLRSVCLALGADYDRVKEIQQRIAGGDFQSSGKLIDTRIKDVSITLRRKGGLGSTSKESQAEIIVWAPEKKA